MRYQQILNILEIFIASLAISLVAVAAFEGNSIFLPSLRM